MEPLFVEAGLLHCTSIAGTLETDGRLRTAMLMWSDVNFSAFAFDLLALLKGTYQQGRASSLHGLDFSALRGKA